MKCFILVYSTVFLKLAAGDNLLVLGVVLGLLCVYSLGMVWATRADRADLRQVRMLP